LRGHDLLLGVLDHLVNLSARQSSNRVLDGDVSLSARGLVLGGNLDYQTKGKDSEHQSYAQATTPGRTWTLTQTVGVDLEGTDKLGLASGHRGDSGKLELSQKPVVLAGSPLSLVNGEGDGGLVVLDGGESPRLVGGDGGVSGQDNSENVTLHGNTEGEGSDIEQQEVGGLVRGHSGEDSGLNGGTVGNGLVGVDRLVQGSASEVLGNEGLNLGDSGRSTNENDLGNLGGGDLGVFEDLLDGVDGRLEGSGVDLLESGSGDVGREVDTLVVQTKRQYKELS